MKEVVLTGATGFVGANLTRRLILDGHKVHLFVRPGSDLWRINDIREEVEIHRVCIEDKQGVDELMRQLCPQRVFHLAVHGAYSWQTNVQSMVATNITGTMNLVEAAIRSGVESFVNTGSSSEYGFKESAACELERLEPNSYYAVTKASATQYCCFVAREHKINLSTLRLYSVYGPWEDPNRLMPTLVVHGLSGELPPLVHPEIARDYVYIDDVVEAYVLAAQKNVDRHHSVFNVGTGTQVSIREVVKVARQVLDIQVEPKWGSMPDRQWDTSTWRADNRKIVEALGWQPQYTFDQGFKALVSWFKSNSSLERYYYPCK